MFILRKPSQSRKSAAMIIVTIMLLVSTAVSPLRYYILDVFVLTPFHKHLAESYVRTRIAVIDLANDPTAAVTFILSPSTSSYIIQDTLYAFQTLMGDAFLVRAKTPNPMDIFSYETCQVYRLYVVYGNNKRILCLAGFLYFGSASEHYFTYCPNI